MRIFVAATLAVLLSVATAEAGTLAGLVVGVTDGDTITVLDDQRTQHKIRLAGIDAPEKAQAFGQRSKEHLSALVFSRRVEVETEKQDRYGRTVGKVVIEGQDVNLAMVVAGMAWHYKKYEGEQSSSDRKLYAEAEQTARGARTGLWSQHDPMSPQKWRHRRLKADHNLPLWQPLVWRGNVAAGLYSTQTQKVRYSSSCS